MSVQNADTCLSQAFAWLLFLIVLVIKWGKSCCSILWNSFLKFWFMGQYSKEYTRQLRYGHSSVIYFLSIWNCDVPCYAVNVVSIIRRLVEWSVMGIGPRREVVLLPAQWGCIHLVSSSISKLKGRQVWQAWVPDDLNVFHHSLNPGFGGQSSARWWQGF